MVTVIANTNKIWLEDCDPFPKGIIRADLPLARMRAIRERHIPFCERGGPDFYDPFTGKSTILCSLAGEPLALRPTKYAESFGGIALLVEKSNPALGMYDSLAQIKLQIYPNNTGSVKMVYWQFNQRPVEENFVCEFGELGDDIQVILTGKCVRDARSRAMKIIPSTASKRQVQFQEALNAAYERATARYGDDNAIYYGTIAEAINYINTTSTQVA